MDAKVGSSSTQKRNPRNVGEAWGRGVCVCVCTTPDYSIMSWGKKFEGLPASAEVG